MAAPTGKLAFAYRTIASLEQQLADVRAKAIIDGLRGENERIRLNIAEYNEAADAEEALFNYYLYEKSE